MSIPAGTNKTTLSVSTLRDSIVEPDEHFKATLTLPGAPEGCVVGTPDMSYITIQDNTRMLELESMHMSSILVHPTLDCDLFLVYSHDPSTVQPG